VVRSVIRHYFAAFSDLPRAVWLLAGGLLVNRAGTMVLPFLTLYVVAERGLTTTQASAVLLAFGLGSMAGSWLGGLAATRWGALRVQVISLLSAGLAFFLYPLLRSVPALVAGAFVLNAVNDAYRPACMTAAVEHAPVGLRLRALALIRLAANLGMAVGPALGGVLATVSYVLLFVGDGATCWLAAVLLLATLPIERGRRSGAPGPEGGPAPRGALRDGRFLTLLAIVFVLAVALFQVFNTVPLHLKRDRGVSEGGIGLLFALNGGMIVIFEMALVRLLEHRDAARLLGFGGFLMCSGFLLLAVAPGYGAAVAMFVVISIGEMLTLPFGNGLAADLAPAGRTGEYMGWYSLTFSLAFVVAPVLGLGLLQRLGPDPLWVAIGCVGAPVWLTALALSRRLIASERAPDARSFG